ncbi:hypothetical protein FisN_24Lh202 [Fistulifera solaris]|uniref:TAZ-type domain-containing protein n=1 Tax=Fistulifera solaris TaxID=1519565 RepID=A0A1Z5K9P0_FISSO|nr:hypothetical protein FisN_24Lh202 [Fistulifera solaris]|eukprot:GAX22916.1 hypothetical protein FisN_24Lh202 [Fistulifera solaris]
MDSAQSSEAEHAVVNQVAQPSNNQQTGRPRSQSVATAQPSVETVVAKSKRAASTLWLLLHAQNCVLGNTCPYSGCQEAKRLHLHLKTCPSNCSVNKSEACPTRCNGCEQARQLLNHYRRCRGERARQGCRKESQHCLICSLVARQAKSMLGKDKMGQSSSSSRFSSSSSSSMISVFNKDIILGDAAMMSGPSPSLHTMPPPPPRRGILTHRVADASILTDGRPLKSISFADEATRPRSSSVVEPKKEILVRSRSLSVGSSPTTCETILEEDGSCSVDPIGEYPTDSSML